MNVRPSPEEFCKKHPQYVDELTYAYPLVYKYHCMVKNGLGLGESDFVGTITANDDLVERRR